MATLISPNGGYQVTIGGQVKVFGSDSPDLISLSGSAGKIEFDGSFNKGGDVIIFPDSSRAYSIKRTGSAISLSAGASEAIIPVGTAGTTIRFADGDLLLKFDGQVLLGTQVVSQSAVQISSSPSGKAALPAAGATAGTLIMAPNEPIEIGGNVRIFGTSGADSVTALRVPGNIVFDASFNRGGDTITVNQLPERYLAKLSGSTLELAYASQTINIPVGVSGAQVAFGNVTRALRYSDGTVYLGPQPIGYQDSPVRSYGESLTYEYIPDAFKGQLPYLQTAATCFADIDVNGDGFKDLVIAFWTGQSSENWGKNVGDIPTPDRLAIFINKDGKYFEDRTAEFLDGSNVLGGASRKVEKVDLNGDGKEDLIFAMNREDGRDSNQWDYNTSFMAALVSQGNKYKIFNFGVKDWYHSVGSGVLNNQLFVTGGGFTGASAGQGGFVFADGKFSETIKLGFDISPNTFLFFNPEGKSNTNFLIQTQAHPNYLGVEGWRFDGSAWVAAGKIDSPFPFVKTVKVITYNGYEIGNVSVYKMGSYYILGGGGFAITESSIIDINRDGHQAVVMKMEVPIITNFDPDKTSIVVQDKETINAVKIVAFGVSNNQIINLNLVIKGEQVEGTNFNYMNVIDVNKDGFDDIYIAPYSITGAPIVYINQRDGTFSNQSIGFKPDFKYHRETANGIMADFNNDGVLDIITMPSNGNNLLTQTSMIDYRYYVGHFMG